jgi:ZIP family zinc transporter
MKQDKNYQSSSYYKIVLQQATIQPIQTIGFLIGILALILLLGQSLFYLFNGLEIKYLHSAFYAGSIGFLSTSLGALPALVVQKISQKTEDIMLGGSAGMMLSASSFSLILPGIESGAKLLNNRLYGAGLVVLGMTFGVLLMLGLDKFIPHEHEKTGPCGAGHERCNRVWLFVFAITLHNLPEGMAMGVGFSKGDFSVGIPLTTAIAIQNIPEGLAVAFSLLAIGLTPGRAVLIACATGLMEVIGSILGVAIAGGAPLAYPIGLGLAGGAMIFVVSNEVIPETHRNGHQTQATLGLMVGFALMMVLDTALG